MVSRKCILLITTAVIFMGLWSTQFFTCNRTGCETASRLEGSQVQKQADNRIESHTGVLIGKQVGGFREILSANRVWNLAVSHMGRKPAYHAQKQVVGSGSQTDTRKESHTSNLAGNKADDQTWGQTDNRRGIHTNNRIGNKIGLSRNEVFNHIASQAGKGANIKQITKNNRCIKRKITHITFLKVHKAGSTTMTFMFFRFGMRNNLTFVLPKTGNYALAGGKSDDILPVKKGEHYDILALHSIYNRTKFNRLLPADSVRIGIIRDPLERMVSAAYYYRDVTKLPYLLEVPTENFIVNLIRNHSIYEKSEFSKTKNSMAKDFGFPATTTRNMTKFISSYISQLTTEFNLVLVMEKFEESLILMKRYLNWELFDILYMAANSNEHNAVSLNVADLELFKHVSFLDYTIYEEFSKMFERKIQLEGNTFVDEVKHFKAVLSLMKDFCSGKSGMDVLHIPASRWTCAFVVTALDCQYIKKDQRVISLPILIKRHIEMHGNI